MSLFTGGMFTGAWTFQCQVQAHAADRALRCTNVQQGVWCSWCQRGQASPPHNWKIPPTEAALFQHVKRALLQASFYCGQATVVQQDIPDFSEWGLHKDGTSTWQPLWTTLNDASGACAILLHYSCIKACAGRCKCNRAGVRCTAI